MLFHSTRGNDNNKTFEEVLMQGLADDGGLFMPDSWPQVDLDHLKSLKSLLKKSTKFIFAFIILA